MHCLSLIGKLDDVRIEELLPLTIELKKSFPLSLVEDVLNEYRPLASSSKLSEVYDQLGFVEKHLKTLQDAKSWTERASAAEKLGQIGHPQAVLPLIAALQDPNEDREVRDIAIRAIGDIRDEPKKSS